MYLNLITKRVIGENSNVMSIKLGITTNIITIYRYGLGITVLLTIEKKTNRYNETPWGFGMGKYRYDNDGDWHSLYAMAFMDSNNRVQPIMGYGFEKNVVSR